MDGAKKTLHFPGALALTVVLLALSGCIGTAAQLLYVIQGDKIDARCNDLKGKRVAVVCVSNASAYGPDTLTGAVEKLLGMKLQSAVKRIKVVAADKVDNWIDVNGWNRVDYAALGRGVDAQMVVAVEIDSYSIHEGSTMYKGRAFVTTTVYDVRKEGEVTFVQGPSEFQFPRSHARPAVGTSEADFERAFLSKLVEDIANLFYDHERLDTIADDAQIFDDL